jgi:hypothetical protein
MGSGGGACGCAIDGYVRSLAVDSTGVYAGTDVNDVAGVAQADHVVRWDGSTWHALGANSAGTDGWFPATAAIYALAADGQSLFATGSFLDAGGDPRADYVAFFHAGQWHPLGSNGAGNGPWSGDGLALALRDSQLFAGGSFTSAGGDAQAHSVASFSLAQVIAQPTPTVTAGPTAVPTPTVTPAPAGPAPDTTAPTAKLGGALTQLAGTTISVLISCGAEPCTAAATARLSVPGAAQVFTLRRVRRAVAANGRVTIKLRVPARARAAVQNALRRGRKVTARVTVRVSDAAGNARAVHRTIRLRRRR